MRNAKEKFNRVIRVRALMIPSRFQVLHSVFATGLNIPAIYSPFNFLGENFNVKILIEE